MATVEYSPPAVSARGTDASLQGRLSALARRRNLQRMVVSLTRSAIPGVALAGASVLLYKLHIIPDGPLWAPPAIIGAFLLWGFRAGWLQRVGSFSAACDADQILNLDDRLSSALSFVEPSQVQHKTRLAPGQGRLAHLKAALFPRFALSTAVSVPPTNLVPALVGEATERAQKLNPKKVYPLRFDRPALILAALSVLFVGFCLMPDFPILQSATEKKQVAVMQKQGEKLVAVAKSVQKDNPPKAAEVQELSRKLEKLGQKMIRGRMTKRAALTEMGELRQQLEKAQAQQRKSPAQNEGAPQIAEALRQAPLQSETGRKVQDKLAQNKWDEAAKALDELADKIDKGQLSDSEREKAAQDLEKTARDLRSRGGEANQKAAEQLEAAANQLRQKQNQGQNQQKQDAQGQQGQQNQGENQQGQQNQQNQSGQQGQQGQQKQNQQGQNGQQQQGQQGQQGQQQQGQGQQGQQSQNGQQGQKGQQSQNGQQGQQGQQGQSQQGQKGQQGQQQQGQSQQGGQQQGGQQGQSQQQQGGQQGQSQQQSGQQQGGQQQGGQQGQSQQQGGRNQQGQQGQGQQGQSQQSGGQQPGQQGGGQQGASGALRDMANGLRQGANPSSGNSQGMQDMMNKLREAENQTGSNGGQQSGKGSPKQGGQGMPSPSQGQPGDSKQFTPGKDIMPSDPHNKVGGGAGLGPRNNAQGVQSGGGVSKIKSKPSGDKRRYQNVWSDRLPKTHKKIDRITGKWGDQGEMEQMATRGEAKGGQVKTPYYEVYESYKHDAEEAVGRDNVPPAYKQPVKDYFESIKP